MLTFDRIRPDPECRLMALAERDPIGDGCPQIVPCTTREFRDEPAEVLEKVLVQDLEVMVFAPLDPSVITRSRRSRPVAVLMPMARYERYAQLEADALALGRAFAESN